MVFQVAGVDPSVAERGAAAMRPTDARTFRTIMGRYPTGVVVVTAGGPDGPVGMAMNSFISVSLDPPMILLCPAASSSTWPLLRESGTIAVNVMSRVQESLCRGFASRDVDRFAQVEWHPGEDGAPLLADATGWIECTIVDERVAGDHTLVLASVDRVGSDESVPEPLVFHSGRYVGLDQMGATQP